MEQEGFSPVGYLDTESVPTAGWGHTGPDVKVGQTYTRDQCCRWLDDDLNTAIRDADSFVFNLDDVRRAVLIMMCFNLGKPRVCGFFRMLGHLTAKDYIHAGYEMLNSRWRLQVKGRAHRLAAAMMTGIWV